MYMYMCIHKYICFSNVYIYIYILFRWYLYQQVYMYAAFLR